MIYKCHSTLADIENEGFSSAGLRLLTGGRRKFPHRLPYGRADISTVQMEKADHMSISGVQDKISVCLQRGELIPVDSAGEYILKPVPSRPLPRFELEVPANEHLTMQIASQIFGISTAANACIDLNDGSSAYITKRFDRRGDFKVPQEDFCQLSGRSPESHGKNYKYDGSYEEMGRILQRHCRAYPVEIEKLFRLIVFNYVFSNGDAHLKNFSLCESIDGDYILTPAYDLVCTSMHLPNEARTALDLFDEFESPFYSQNGFYGADDFLQLGKVFGMQDNRAEAVIRRFADAHDRTVALIERSFLSDEAKADYGHRLDDRLKAISRAH